MTKYLLLAAALIALSVACNKKEEQAPVDAAPVETPADAAPVETPADAPAEVAPSDAPAEAQ